MKKFVIFALIAAVAAGGVFAQTADGISINGFGRGAFVPLQSHSAPQTNGETPSGAEGVNYAGTAVTWGADYGGAVRTDFRVNGNAEFVGFQVQVTGDGGTPGIENTHIWAKPFGSDILKLTIGRYEVDNLRGKIATDTGFESFVAGGLDEDTIFNRFRGNGGKANAIITSEPMEGLFIGLEIPGVLDTSGNNSLLLDAYRHMQLGFGYQIPDIGHFRAQYLGGWAGDVDGKTTAADALKKKYKDPLTGLNTANTALQTALNALMTNTDPTQVETLTAAYVAAQAGAISAAEKFDFAQIQVAFALTAVDGLLVDIGLKLGLPVTFKYDGDTVGAASKGVDVGIGATYRADAFAVAATIAANFGAYAQIGDDAKYRLNRGMGLDVNVIPTYDLDAATIGASIGLRTKAADTTDGESAKNNTMQVGFGGFVKKDLGSGHIKAGLAYTTAKTTNGKANGSGIFTIPIILEYAFF